MNRSSLPLRRYAVPSALALLAACASGCQRHLPSTPMGDEAAFEDRSGELTQTLLTENGGRVDWSAANDLIAFDRLADDGFFDVWTMRPDGSGQSCFTCDLPGLPRKNVGQPAWNPEGTWLVVQAQKADSDVRSFSAHPGRGVRNDLWAVSYPGGAAYPLTDVPDEAGRGVLHPHFSPDGRALLWGEMTGPADLLDKAAVCGTWVLKSARFVISADGPRLEHPRELSAGPAPVFHENHGLSPDGERWIFSANLDPGKPLAELNDIYLLDYASGENLTRFTWGGYNEHATFTPDGTRIIWMSNAGNENRGTDYWVANLDGSGLARLSSLNKERGRKRAIAADLSAGPDGSSFVAYVQHGVGGGTGSIILFRGL